MEKVHVYFADGFEEVEALTVVDVLRRAQMDARMVSVTGDLVVTGAHNIQVSTDLLWEEAMDQEVHMIVLPGGMPGTKNLEVHQGLMDKILTFQAEDKWIGAICAAPSILGKLGILTNKKATCYPGFEKELKGARYLEETVVQDGKIITSRGVGTAMGFALKLVEVLQGKTKAEDLRKKMIV